MGDMFLAPQFSVSEFNRRAAIALRGVTFLPASFEKRFSRDVRELIERGGTPSEKQQHCLYNIVHRFRRQITDRSLLEWAAARAKGADA